MKVKTSLEATEMKCFLMTLAPKEAPGLSHFLMGLAPSGLLMALLAVTSYLLAVAV
jgi:hypothetical protein